MTWEKANLKQWLTAAIGHDAGEAIEAIVIGDGGDADKPPQIYNTLLSWAQASPMLDYDFTEMEGRAGCNPIYVWTAESIFLIGAYDGSTRLVTIPRHPTTCTPTYV